MRKLKAVLYWVTLIPPVFDIVRSVIIGIRDGVKKGLADIKEAEQKAAFERANNGNV